MNNTKKILSKKYFEIFYNERDESETDKIVDELVADDFVDFSPAFGSLPNKAGFKQTVKLIVTAFSQKYKVKHLFSDEDVHTAVWEAKVKHTGEFMGIQPTNKEFSITGITIYKIVNGKIKAHWEQFDALKIMTEIQNKS